MHISALFFPHFADGWREREGQRENSLSLSGIRAPHSRSLFLSLFLSRTKISPCFRLGDIDPNLPWFYACAVANGHCTTRRESSRGKTQDSMAWNKKEGARSKYTALTVVKRETREREREILATCALLQREFWTQKSFACSRYQWTCVLEDESKMHRKKRRRIRILSRWTRTNPWRQIFPRRINKWKWCLDAKLSLTSVCEKIIRQVYFFHSTSSRQSRELKLVTWTVI